MNANTVNEGISKSSGSILKEKREASGLSLETVHEATKIPLDVLRAIEEGYTVRNLSPFYYKGFLKIYANYLNVNLSEVIENYKVEKPPKYIPRRVEENPFAQLQEEFLKFFTRERKRQLLIGLAILAGLFLFYKMILAIKSNSKNAPPKSASLQNNTRKEKPKPAPILKVEKREEPTIVIPVKEGAKEAAVLVPAVIAEPRAQKGVSLTVRARKNSWLTVKGDGEVMFQSTLRAGAVETWLANNKIELSGKNIDQLEFELNGKTIGTLSRSESRAKSVTVTRDGLSVTK